MKTKKDVDSAVGLEVTSANGRGSQPAQYRENASTIIKRVAAEKEKRVQLIELSMEEETQSGDREFAVGVTKRWVQEADCVLVVGWNCGTISDEVSADRLSVTESEYRHATAYLQ